MHSLTPPLHSHVCEVLVSWLRHCRVSSAPPGACWAVLEQNEVSSLARPLFLPCLPFTSTQTCTGQLSLESATTRGLGCRVRQGQTKINTIFKALLTRRSQKCCSRRCCVQSTFSLFHLPSFLSWVNPKRVEVKVVFSDCWCSRETLDFKTGDSSLP